MSTEALFDAGEGYAGSAQLRVGDVAVDVSVALSGRFEPVDGAYHWSGRTNPDAVLAAAVRAGQRSAVLCLPGRGPVPVRLAEVDPWGGLRLVGAGTPPWQAAQATH